MSDMPPRTNVCAKRMPDGEFCIDDEGHPGKCNNPVTRRLGPEHPADSKFTRTPRLTAEQIEGARARLLLRRAYLDHRPETDVIQCIVCDGKSPEPDACGCGGTMTIAAARKHIEMTLEILSK